METKDAWWRGYQPKGKATPLEREAQGGLTLTVTNNLWSGKSLGRGEQREKALGAEKRPNVY